jgi:hypothetical protein
MYCLCDFMYVMYIDDIEYSLVYCGLFRSYFSFVLGFVASFHLLPVIYIVCIKYYVNYASRAFTLYIPFVLTLLRCVFVSWSRQNECLGLCGYCYSWLWWGWVGVVLIFLLQ